MGGIWHWEMMAEQSLGLKLLQVREQWNFYQEKFDDQLLWLQNTMLYLVVIVTIKNLPRKTLRYHISKNKKTLKFFKASNKIQ